MLPAAPSTQPDIPATQPERLPWAGLAWFGALLLVSYAPILARLVGDWIKDEDMGHGFFVPVLAGYIAWKRRGELFQVTPRPNYWGLALAVYAAVQMYIATLGVELFLARTSFIFSLAGTVLWLGGTHALRVLAFPLFLLFFMVPIPSVIYYQITFPLQLLASRVAETALSWMGYPVLREGNVLELASQKLSVAEACSGIRSLLSLSFLSLVYGYFYDHRAWMRVVLLIGTVPIAIVANASRVTMTGMLSEIRPDLAEGFLHLASGWVIFMVAVALLVAFHHLINLACRGIPHAR